MAVPLKDGDRDVSVGVLVAVDTQKLCQHDQQVSAGVSLPQLDLVALVVGFAAASVADLVVAVVDFEVDFAAVIEAAMAVVVEGAVSATRAAAALVDEVGMEHLPLMPPLDLAAVVGVSVAVGMATPPSMVA